MSQSMYSITIHNAPQFETVTKVRYFNEEAFAAISDDGQPSGWYGWATLEDDLLDFSTANPDLQFSVDEYQDNGKLKRYTFHKGLYKIIKGDGIWADKAQKLEIYLRDLLDDEEALIQAQEDFIGFVGSLLNRL